MKKTLNLLCIIFMLVCVNNVNAQFGKKMLKKVKKAVNIKDSSKKEESNTEVENIDTEDNNIQEPTTQVTPQRVSRYIGNGTSREDHSIIYNIDNDGYVYKGISNKYASDVVCGLYEGKVYKGTSQYNSDVICTIEKDGTVYSGTSDYTSDILFHFHENGTAAYRKTSIHSSEIIFRYDKDGYVYKGNSDYASDVVFNIDGEFTREEIVALWIAIQGL